jgi:hypothetical protein
MKGLENALAPLILLGFVALILLQRRRITKHQRDDRD